MRCNYVKAAGLGGLLLLAACASRQPTVPNSQAEALRIVTLCTGGLSNSLSAKLKASYVKYSAAEAEATAAEEAKGIIFSDSFTNGMTSADKLALSDKYIACVRAERSP